MELELSLGDASSSKPFAFMEKAAHHRHPPNKGFAFTTTTMGLALASPGDQQLRPDKSRQLPDLDDCGGDEEDDNNGEEEDGDAAAALPLQLDLLPLVPVPRSQAPHQGLPWPSSDNDNRVREASNQKIQSGNFVTVVGSGSSEAGSSGNVGRGVEVNRYPAGAGAGARVEESEEGAGVEVESSPNSAASSFQMEFSIYGGGGANMERERERASSRASDDDDNGQTRKKLRLSKEQSAFLEESFKEHNTLNPKQKQALAKQLNLLPRQVEVWFQNRRARTKLKQTEVDCEYLKRCCDTLTEENRRLQKELQELRALKSSNPFYMQLPATTLTMCPSCERVATSTSTAAPAAAAAPDPSSRPRFYPFSHHPSSAPS